MISCEDDFFASKVLRIWPHWAVPFPWPQWLRSTFPAPSFIPLGHVFCSFPQLPLLSSVSLTLRLSVTIYPSFNCCFFLFLRLKESGYFLNLFLSLSENVKGRPKGWHVEGKTVESILESKTILFNAADLCVARIYLKTPGPLCSSVLPAWSL